MEGRSNIPETGCAKTKVANTAKSVMIRRGNAIVAMRMVGIVWV